MELAENQKDSRRAGEGGVTQKGTYVPSTWVPATELQPLVYVQTFQAQDKTLLMTKNSFMSQI